MSEQFKLFLSLLSETNATLDYFTDFKKITSNINKISIKLHQLNYLIGKKDLKQAVNELYEENKGVFQVLDVLIAVRKKDKKKVINNEGKIVLLETYFESAEKILEYIKDTGLAEVFKNCKIANLVDYVFGIEVGLDTNARKNRGGDKMEKAVALIFDNAKIFHKKQVNITNFPEILSLGEDLKCFDFAIKTKRKTYLIEANFYNSTGSKLNETARSYSDVASKINQCNNFEFVWITDGQVWRSAANKLQEAFSVIPSMYNLATLHLFIEKLNKEKTVSF
ncbi:type II restriction endonuclease [uncultured Candidatus Kuenenia sp.]|jgi:type II restriction enzyme|uniref:type II restriction endonuclease n=1 Tax=uncultured Candidatus Kuenenia sp. TaxID=1048336 RepID=UPI0025D00606|nr:type II restriction endonuclease [uncultured Candidatus Kuenenia sp.]